MLRMRDVHAGYGATPILFGVSLEVRAGEAVALLGKNGMGKTTLMKTAMGFLKPWRGTIEYDGADLTRLTPHAIARLGIGFVPETRRIFPGLTVRENLELGLSAASKRPGGGRAPPAPRSPQGSSPRGVCPPPLSRHIRDMVGELKRLGVTVLLVEQNARVALSVCDRGYIMEKGSIVFEASSRELRESPVTREKLGV